jgi:Chemotaxis response regulator containing a CheY-like receiver domain and a methylesterase domain|uniref:Protein-glutamate methylesterase/protein-glutamine glutaminase 1 n=2 Tax=Syntrophus TaxID=43773 RepID=CHEB1_SYNAS|nr:RecName: Full=Protein-glutamate methylesterase/protein-glutamine glutaminase 1 [Syntrophus aciditrophicus SB]
MIKVLIVEDSPVVRELLSHILHSDPQIRVVGVAESGEEALKEVVRLRPDLITMDVNLPRMDGFETTRRIMEEIPTPIIIVSAAWVSTEVEKTFRALEAGALAVLEKPSIAARDYDIRARDLIRAVKAMSEVKVIRRWSRSPRIEPAPPASGEPDIGKITKRFEVVAMGASTGGPTVLKQILSDLPDNFTIPILIVQHMTQGFIPGFVDWLSRAANYPVSVAVHGEEIRPGHAYVAPDGLHMGVNALGKIILTKGEPENGLCPSVSYLFRSVYRAYGENAVGVLLTGMGKDGAYELKVMKDCGMITIAQNKETSVVYGMPGEAIGMNAASYVLPPEKIARVLVKLAGSVAP